MSARPHTPISFCNISESKLTIPPAAPVRENPLASSPYFSPATLSWCSSWWKPIIAEFLSTAFLILLGCMTCVSLPNSNDSPTYVPLGFGLVVLVNIQIFGHISGAFMNPSVSMAAVLWGCIPVSVGLSYVVAQFLGAIVGYGLLLSVSPLNMLENGTCVTEPIEPLKWGQSLFIEVLLTTTMNLMNCGVWDPISKEKQDSLSIKLGLAITGLSLAGGAMTGASMNPARSFAPALWTNTWNHHWIYWVGPFIGAIIPVYMYKYLLMTPVDEVKN